MPTNDTLKTVALDTLHRELGARMVPFAGYSMPVQYPSGILAEHKHTRDSAGFFDISHMGQIRISGSNVAKGLENLVPSNVGDLPAGRQRYTVFTTDSAGVLDDLMITNFGDFYFLVVNASRKDVVRQYLVDRLPQCDIEFLDNRALIALQGPKASTVLSCLMPAACQLEFLSAGQFVVDSVDCLISRCGYTGEDGFEISLPISQVESIVRIFLDQPEVIPVGLGARDSLRMEAGLCLYGHELDESTTLVEAGLEWIVAKRYRESTGDGACFPGAEVVLDQIRNGAKRTRIGLIPEGRAPVREGVEILNDNNEVVGRISSGGFGPTVGGPIAMAYVEREYAVEGSRLNAILRNKPCSVKVSALPFIQHRYFSS